MKKNKKQIAPIQTESNVFLDVLVANRRNHIDQLNMDIASMKRKLEYLKSKENGKI